MSVDCSVNGCFARISRSQAFRNSDETSVVGLFRIILMAPPVRIDLGVEWCGASTRDDFRHVRVFNLEAALLSKCSGRRLRLSRIISTPWRGGFSDNCTLCLSHFIPIGLLWLLFPHSRHRISRSIISISIEIWLGFSHWDCWVVNSRKCVRGRN